MFATNIGFKWPDGTEDETQFDTTDTAELINLWVGFCKDEKVDPRELTVEYVEEVQLQDEPESDEEKPELNTLFSYMYRDACNYKNHGEFVAQGTLTEEEKKQIRDSLDGDDFIAEQVGFPSMRFSEMTEDDHSWHELIDITETDKAAAQNVTAKQVLEAFLKAKGNWDDVTYFSV